MLQTVINASPPASTPEGTILLVIPWSPTAVGGVSTVVRHLREQWLAAGQSVRLAVESWPDRLPRLQGDELHFRFSVSGARSGWRRWAGLPGAAASLVRTARLLKQQRVGAVNFHYPSLQALGVALLKRWGLFNGRLVLSFHGTDVCNPQTGSPLFRFSQDTGFLHLLLESPQCIFKRFVFLHVDSWHSEFLLSEKVCLGYVSAQSRLGSSHQRTEEHTSPSAP